MEFDLDINDDCAVCPPLSALYIIVCATGSIVGDGISSVCNLLITSENAISTTKIIEPITYTGVTASD